MQPKMEKASVKVGHRFQEAMQRYQQAQSNNSADEQSTTQEDSVTQTTALTDENKQENPEMVHTSDADDKLQEPIEAKKQIDATNLNDALFAQLANPVMVSEPSTEQSPLQEAVVVNHLVPNESMQTDDAIPTPYSVVAKQVDASTMELTIKQATEKTNIIDGINQSADSIDDNTEQLSLNQTKLNTEEAISTQVKVVPQENLSIKKVDRILPLTVADSVVISQVASLQDNLNTLNQKQVMMQPTSFTNTAEQNQVSVAEVLTNQVAQKIVEHTQTLNAPGMQKVTIQLQPDQLGKLEISLQLNQHQVQLEVKAENSHTMKLLENLSTKFEQILNKQQFLQQPTPARLEIPTQNEGLGSALQQNFQQNFQQSNFYQSKPVNRYAKSTEKITVEEETTDKEVLDSTISILA